MPRGLDGARFETEISGLSRAHNFGSETHLSGGAMSAFVLPSVAIPRPLDSMALEVHAGTAHQDSEHTVMPYVY